MCLPSSATCSVCIAWEQHCTHTSEQWPTYFGEWQTMAHRSTHLHTHTPPLHLTEEVRLPTGRDGPSLDNCLPTLSSSLPLQKKANSKSKCLCFLSPIDSATAVHLLVQPDCQRAATTCLYWAVHSQLIRFRDEMLLSFSIPHFLKGSEKRGDEYFFYYVCLFIQKNPNNNL